MAMFFAIVQNLGFGAWTYCAVNGSDCIGDDDLYSSQMLETHVKIFIL